ncbi:MAG: class I poly(R)-hydroxyalkanoic acid synthase [Betaproteobacteria bacterium]|nr:class I poly(R)-hydroxyalkanoic acid synthase [Betaproteobacteria bacterium]
MAATPEQTLAAMQKIFQSGQTLVQALMEFAGTGQGMTMAQPGTNAHASAASQTMDDALRMGSIQQEHAELHARLWSQMLGRKPGEALPSVVQPEPGDRRFSSPDWSASPYFHYLQQVYLINAQFLKRVSEEVPVADRRAKDRMRFLTRQVADALAPSNFAATNPEFVKATLETKGENIRAGIHNMLGDLRKGRISMTDESAFEVGRNLAVTPGAVIYENELMQVIQYAPITSEVFKLPLVIIPPCINKYYVLDLQPDNSFVRHAVEQGHSVFLASWRNVTAEHGHLTWDDYLEQGALTALRVAKEVAGEDRVNALGFCVGGTILASALAVARARGEDPVQSLTLLTTLLDFTDSGDIGCLVDEALVAARETAIGQGGLLPGRELESVFSSLRANDLVWQYVVGNYLKGRTPGAFDILYWNSDSTNLPGPFLTWYLRNMYLENNLRIPGKLRMCGVPADLGNVDAPAYLLATREDHIVPWQSAYLSRQMLGAETTFVLGASGHIAGVINPPSKNRRSYWVAGNSPATAVEWQEAATEHKGSWWAHWHEWLRPHGGTQKAAPRTPGSKKYPPLEAAPGRYVKERA